MYSKIVLAGGSGYLGSVLTDHFRHQCSEMIILSRYKHASQGHIHYRVWDGKTKNDWCKELEHADLLVNLAGRNVNCRYNRKNKEEILNSRLDATRILGEVIPTLQHPPKTWINLASATIYRHAEDHPQDEVQGEKGSGFSVNVCKAWEKSFSDAITPFTKKIILRTGIVIGKKDEVLPKLIRLVRFGLGGRIGNGRQFVSWIHEKDFAQITEWAHLNAADGDVFNVTAPVAVKNIELMQLIRAHYDMRFGLPSPQWLLEAGAFLIGTETELVLKSRWVIPQSLLTRGYRFDYPDIRSALGDILKKRDEKN